MISKKEVGTRMNSAVAINARIFTSIIESFYTSQYQNNSGFNPLELILNRISIMNFQDLIVYLIDSSLRIELYYLYL